MSASGRHGVFAVVKDIRRDFSHKMQIKYKFIFNSIFLKSRNRRQLSSATSIHRNPSQPRLLFCGTCTSKNLEVGETPTGKLVLVF